VFLGGHIERHRKEVQAVLAEEIQRNWPYPDEVQCRIHFSSLGEKAVAFGAAGMVLHHLFAGTNLTDGIGRMLATLLAGPTTAAGAIKSEENPFVGGEKNKESPARRGD
jgi:hypothetical protein